MTYMPQSEFSNATSESNPSTVDKVKVLAKESSARSQRVMEILRTAFTETIAEVKDGRAVISPLAKEVTAETVATVKSQSQKAADILNDTWQQESNQKDLSERLIAVIRNLASTLKVKLLPQLKNQTGKLDNVLNERYGDRYESLKDQFDLVRTWIVVPEQTTPDTESASSDASAIEVESEVIG
ncbi:MAG: hypothetical protein AAF171_09200 [Cyanobacteria bacterium P01_A01_bin.116]